MAKTDDQVMELVRSELKKNPDIKSGDLFEIAKKSVPSVGKLSVRQFHARYPLQIKRDQAFASGGSSSGTSAKTRRKRGARKATGRKKSRTSAPAQSTAAASGTAGNGPDRDAVRAVFMRFAADLSAAEARKDLVKLVAGIDRYVDDAIAAAR